MARNNLSDAAARLDDDKWERARENDAAQVRDTSAPWSHADLRRMDDTDLAYAVINLRNTRDAYTPGHVPEGVLRALRQALTVQEERRQARRHAPRPVATPPAPISPHEALPPSAWGPDAARLAAQDAYTARHAR